MVEALQFSEGGSFNITVWITAFYRDLTRIYTPEQDGDANPEIVCSRWVKKKGEFNFRKLNVLSIKCSFNYKMGERCLVITRNTIYMVVKTLKT